MQRLLIILSAMATMFAPLAWAQGSYPNRPIYLVVPAPAGGTLDGIARMLQPQLSKIFKQSVIVENKAGAGQRQGNAYVARARPDGYTLLIAYDTFPIDPLIYKNLPYDPWKDFTPVSLLVKAPLLAVASKSFPPNNIQELIAYAKAHPGKINFASTGIGSPPQLADELFMGQTGTKMFHVPYNGGAPAMIDLLAGRVELIWGTPAFANVVINSGKVKILGQAAASRSSAYPELQTVEEQGVPNFEVYTFLGILAPSGTPVDVINRWHDALVKIAKLPASVDWFNQQGYQPVISTPAEFGDFLRAMSVKWAKVIKQAKIPKQ